MTDCFQPCELQYHTTYQTVQEMNLCRVSYLIVTKSALPAAPEYLEILDKELAYSNYRDLSGRYTNRPI